jgi:NAD(P)-dependent dehydrogenase (short-subunit alcohol dehydrogenase family)
MAPGTLSLDGKVVIITGSGKENGIGAGIASALARNGSWVTINCKASRQQRSTIGTGSSQIP